MRRNDDRFRWLGLAAAAALVLACPEIPPVPPLDMDRAPLFQFVTTGDADGSQPAGKLPEDPFYATWDVFPGPASDPNDFVNLRLGLATHGRWVTTYVNPIAFAHIEAYLKEVETVPVGDVPVVPRTDFPAGSIIVKENFGNDPRADVVAQAPRPGVLTVIYKPLQGGCQSGHELNGSDCLGGGWLWAFYGLDNRPEGPDLRPLDGFVADNTGSFCVNCHSPAFKADYLRGLLRRARDVAFTRVPATDPGVPPPDGVGDPFCAEVELSPELPADVPLDPAGVADPAQRQRMFDCFAWRAFVALNWPAAADRGEPDAGAPFNRPQGDRVWETLTQTYEVFQPLDPDWTPGRGIWDEPRRLPPACADAERGAAVLALTSKSQSAFPDVGNETGQAFAGSFGTLTDRNGNFVHYQVLFNETEFDYFLAGGKAATRNLTPVGPADGPEASLPDGSVEVKAAWKVLCTEDTCAQRDRAQDYYSRDVRIYDAGAEGGPTCEQESVGLVGLHVAAKTFWAPQWIWATFEHQRNAPTYQPVVGGPPPPEDDYVFYDPSCPPDLTRCFKQPFLLPKEAGADPCCPNLEINRAPGIGFTGPDRPNNQLTRIDPIDGSGLNATFQGLLAAAGSPFQSYVLVNTQWPFNGRRPASAGEHAVNTRQCAGNEVAADGTCFTRVPADLRNTVIESYMTTWDNDAAGRPQQISNRSCLSCHASGTGFSYVFEDAVEQIVPLAASSGSP
jgi:hypothetical protein